MLRLFGAVLAGSIFWGVIWNVDNAVLMRLFPELLQPGEPIEPMGFLLYLIAFSVILSMAAGYLTASLARERARRAVLILAILQLAIGIGVEVGYWSLMPVWYHLLFLALIVPATLAGGKLQARRGGVAAQNPGSPDS